MIRHTMNFFWGYGTKISFLRYLTLATFRAQHPEWEMCLWQSDWASTALGWNFHEFQSKFRQSHDWSEEARSLLGVKMMTYNPENKKILQMPPPNISDIFSYETLMREGGWYSDMDVMFVKNLDLFCDSDSYAFIGFGGLDDWVGIFGAERGSWVMRSFYEKCVDSFEASSYNSTGSYGIIKHCTTNIDWINRFGDPDNGRKNWRAPSDMFYPLRPQQSARLWSEEWETPRPNTWAVHLYGGNQDFALFNRKVTPEYVQDGTHKEWVVRFARELPAYLVPKVTPTKDTDGRRPIQAMAENLKFNKPKGDEPHDSADIADVGPVGDAPAAPAVEPAEDGGQAVAGQDGGGGVGAGSWDQGPAGEAPGGDAVVPGGGSEGPAPGKVDEPGVAGVA